MNKWQAISIAKNRNNPGPHTPLGATLESMQAQIEMNQEMILALRERVADLEAQVIVYPSQTTTIARYLADLEDDHT